MIQSQGQGGGPGISIRNRGPLRPPAGRPAEVAAGLSPSTRHRPIRVAARARQFMVLTSGALTVGQFWIVLKSAFDRSRPHRRERIATVDELPVGGAKRSPTPKAAHQTARPDRKEPRSSPTTSSARTCSARWCPQSTRPAALPLPLAGLISREAGPSRARRSAVPRVLLDVRDASSTRRRRGVCDVIRVSGWSRAQRLPIVNALPPSVVLIIFCSSGCSRRR